MLPPPYPSLTLLLCLFELRLFCLHLLDVLLRLGHQLLQLLPLFFALSFERGFLLLLGLYLCVDVRDLLFDGVNGRLHVAVSLEVQLVLEAVALRHERNFLGVVLLGELQALRLELANVGHADATREIAEQFLFALRQLRLQGINGLRLKENIKKK